MKGLLIKDFYMIIKYCKAYLLIFVIFIIVSAVGDDNFFFSFYLCLISGMMPATLLGHDEQSKWSQYCGTLPYTKVQIVSGKYLIGLFAQITVIAVSALTQAIRMNISETFDIKGYFTLMALLLILSCFSSSISLPFMFKYGVEKGRIAYYIMIGVVCGGGAAAARLFENMETVEFSAGGLLPILCIVMFSIYALSWYLSIVFYKKREI